MRPSFALYIIYDGGAEYLYNNLLRITHRPEFGHFTEYACDDSETGSSHYSRLVWHSNFQLYLYLNIGRDNKILDLLSGMLLYGKVLYPVGTV